jgi:hypothetical protein
LRISVHTNHQESDVAQLSDALRTALAV